MRAQAQINAEQHQTAAKHVCNYGGFRTLPHPHSHQCLEFKQVLQCYLTDFTSKLMSSDQTSANKNNTHVYLTVQIRDSIRGGQSMPPTILQSLLELTNQSRMNKRKTDLADTYAHILHTAKNTIPQISNLSTTILTTCHKMNA